MIVESMLGIAPIVIVGVVAASAAVIGIAVSDTLQNLMYVGLWNILTAFCHFIYMIWRSMAWCINIMEDIFRKLAGIDPLYYQEKGSNEYTDGDIATLLIRQGPVQQIFWNLVAVAMVLLIFFTIVKIIQENYKVKDEGNPYQIIFRTIKGMCLFVFIPAAVVVGLMVSGVVFKALDQATGGGEGKPLSGHIFRAMAYNANRKRMGPQTGKGGFSDIRQSQLQALAKPHDEGYYDPARTYSYVMMSREDYHPDMVYNEEYYPYLDSKEDCILWRQVRITWNDHGLDEDTKLGCYDVKIEDIISSMSFPERVYYREPKMIVVAPDGPMGNGGGGGIPLAYSLDRGSPIVRTGSVSARENAEVAYGKLVDQVHATGMLKTLEGNKKRMDRIYYSELEEDWSSNIFISGSFNNAGWARELILLVPTTNLDVVALKDKFGSRSSTMSNKGWSNTKIVNFLKTFNSADNFGIGYSHGEIDEFMVSRQENSSWILVEVRHEGRQGGVGTLIGGGDSAVVKDASIVGIVSYQETFVVSALYEMLYMDYLIGFAGIFIVGGVFINFTFGLIQRLFEMVVLFAFSPLTIAFFPFDNGTAFNSHFVKGFYQKTISVYAIVISMNAFFLLYPIFQNIKLFRPSGTYVPGNISSGGNIVNLSADTDSELLTEESIVHLSAVADNEDESHDFANWVFNMIISLSLISMLPKIRTLIASMLGASDQIDSKNLFTALKEGAKTATGWDAGLKHLPKAVSTAGGIVNSIADRMAMNEGKPGFFSKQADRFNNSRLGKLMGRDNKSKEDKAKAALRAKYGDLGEEEIDDMYKMMKEEEAQTKTAERKQKEQAKKDKAAKKAEQPSLWRDMKNSAIGQSLFGVNGWWEKQADKPNTFLGAISSWQRGARLDTRRKNMQAIRGEEQSREKHQADNEAERDALFLHAIGKSGWQKHVLKEQLYNRLDEFGIKKEEADAMMSGKVKAGVNIDNALNTVFKSGFAGINSFDKNKQDLIKENAIKGNEADLKNIGLNETTIAKLMEITNLIKDGNIGGLEGKISSQEINKMRVDLNTIGAISDAKRVVTDLRKIDDGAVRELAKYGFDPNSGDTLARVASVQSSFVDWQLGAKGREDIKEGMRQAFKDGRSFTCDIDGVKHEGTTRADLTRLCDMINAAAAEKFHASYSDVDASKIKNADFASKHGEMMEAVTAARAQEYLANWKQGFDGLDAKIQNAITTEKNWGLQFTIDGGTFKFSDELKNCINNKGESGYFDEKVTNVIKELIAANNKAAIDNLRQFADLHAQTYVDTNGTKRGGTLNAVQGATAELAKYAIIDTSADRIKSYQQQCDGHEESFQRQVDHYLAAAKMHKDTYAKYFDATESLNKSNNKLVKTIQNFNDAIMKADDAGKHQEAANLRAALRDITQLVQSIDSRDEWGRNGNDAAEVYLNLLKAISTDTMGKLNRGLGG